MAAIPLFRRQVCGQAGSSLRRSFSTTGSVQAAYGFIGLGRMGMPDLTAMTARCDSRTNIA